MGPRQERRLREGHSPPKADCSAHVLPALFFLLPFPCFFLMPRDLTIDHALNCMYLILPLAMDFVQFCLRFAFTCSALLNSKVHVFRRKRLFCFPSSPGEVQLCTSYLALGALSVLRAALLVQIIPKGTAPPCADLDPPPTLQSRLFLVHLTSVSSLLFATNKFPRDQVGLS